MPQKKNPDAAELLRAKAPRVVTALAGLHGVLHALPLAYSKDMQEDKEGLFDAAETLEVCLEAAAGMFDGISFNRERLEAAAADEFLPPPTSPTYWCETGCRSAKPTVWSADWCASRWRRE